MEHAGNPKAIEYIKVFCYNRPQMNKLVKHVVNIPFVWNAAQTVIGANKWKDWMYPSVFQKRGGTLLDFGCSSGNETPQFLDFDYYGVDIDPQVITAAQRKFKQYPNVQFFSLDIIKDGFKKDFFDHVLFAGTGHHLTDDELKKIIDILLENLKQGGQLHFFDLVRQPKKDGWMTQMIINADQGKHARTQQEYESIFEPSKYHVTETKLFPNPYRLIRFPDFLYLCVVKD